MFFRFLLNIRTNPGYNIVDVDTVLSHIDKLAGRSGSSPLGRCSASTGGWPSYMRWIMRKGCHHTEESKAKMRAAAIGYPNPRTGRKHTAETKAKLRAAQLGKKHTEEAKAKCRVAHLRKNLSSETLAKMRAARLGTHHTAETKAKISAANLGGPNGRLGIKHTEETLAKMREAHLRKNLSSETLAKMSAAHSGKKHTEEAKAKMSATHSGRTRNYGRVYKHGWHFSPKMQTKFWYRSSWELAAMKALDNSHLVKDYEAEPFALPYVKRRGQVRHYTPDLLVHYTDRRTELIEITRQSDIEKKRFKAAAAHQWCIAHDARFVFLVGDGRKEESQ